MSIRVTPKTDNVYLIRSQTNSGIHQWHYVEVARQKYPLFLRASQSGSFDCASFGRVLASGIGNDPPAHLWWELQHTLNTASTNNSSVT